MPRISPIVRYAVVFFVAAPLVQASADRARRPGADALSAMRPVRAAARLLSAVVAPGKAASARHAVPCAEVKAAGAPGKVICKNGVCHVDLSGTSTSGKSQAKHDPAKPAPTAGPPQVEKTVPAPAPANAAKVAAKVGLTEPAAKVAAQADAAPPALEKVDPAGPGASQAKPADLPKAIAGADAQQPAEHQPAAPAKLVWLTSYREAMTRAIEGRKMLFVFFHDTNASPSRRAFETVTLAHPEIKKGLSRYVLASLPRNMVIKVKGQNVCLMRHPAFGEMQGRQGVAILDFAHPKAEYYGRAVSTFPFTPGMYYRREALQIVLDLPPGTLTQRTMIYAVRIHPESPASTKGRLNPVLADEAKQHSLYQASITLQGHHSWDSRFERINSKLPGGLMAQEVVAESWPNEDLVTACVDCVNSWRQSPGHWGAVRSRHPFFGYDIKRGRNGIWYATGIFGRR